MAFKMFIDGESNGLYGQTFAVGYVVRDEFGKELESGYAGAPFEIYEDLGIADAWVKKNVVPHLPAPTHATAKDVRDWLWERWMHWKALGAELWADCAYPVETGLMADCVADDPENRTWNGPYPIHESATTLKAAGMDPTGTYDRREDELPKHHPTADARQSARLEFEAAEKIASGLALYSLLALRAGATTPESIQQFLTAIEHPEDEVTRRDV